MKNLMTIFNLLLFPFLFLMRFSPSRNSSRYPKCTSSSMDRVHSHWRRWERGKYLFVIFLLFSFSGLNAADYKCDGEKVNKIHNAEADKYKSYSTKDKDKNSRYFRFKTKVNGNITITQKNNKAQAGYYNHKLTIGTSCKGTDIHNGSGTTHDSDTFSVTAKTWYYVRVQETNVKKQLNFDIDFDFTVSSSNNTPTDIALSNSSIDENNAIGDTIGAFSTTDVDASDTHTYSLVSGSGDTDNGSFTISGNQLKAGEVFDAGIKSNYSIRVQTNDGNGGIFEKTFTVTINAVAGNSDPTDIALSNNSIEENNAIGDTIGDFSTTDDDASNTHAYSLVSGSGDTDNGSFTISGNQLKAGEVFDAGIKSSYSIRVQTNDGNGGTFEKTFLITVTVAINEGYRPFTLRYQTNIVGDMRTIGNTILVAPQNNGSANCNTYTDGAYIDDATSSNAKYKLCAYYADSSVNFPTTKAQLPLPNDPSLKVKWAGLYWQALVDNSYDISQMQIKIKHENDSSYNTIGFDQLDWGDGVGHSGQISYSAFKDVTSLFVNNGWKDGDITVGNIPVIEGKISSLGTYGAWSLVVVYEQMSEELRNVTIYDGWQQVDSSNTEVDISIADFITPKSTPISAEISVFAAEGDKHINGDYLKAKPSKKSTWTNLSHVSNQTFNSSIEVVIPFTRTPDPANNQGIDIQAFDIGTSGVNIMEPKETKIDLKFGSDQDRYWPSMIAFSADLYKPDFCYDYSYKQNEQYFTEENNGSLDPRIVGHGLSTTDPITVELYIQNRENSDILAKNMTLDIFDINTTQAIYSSNSTYLIPPGSVFKELQNDTNSSNSYNNGIDIGTVDGKQYFYLDYDLSPKRSDIDMRLNIRLQYDLVLPEITIPRTTYLNKGIPMCSSDNFAYVPTYGTFNVENSILSQSRRYNLPTQTANRAGDFVVTAYEDNAIHTRKSLSTVVAVELIDAGKYHGIDASCHEPDSALTPRVWTTFGNMVDGNVSMTDFDATTINYAIANNMVSDGISGGTSLASAETFYGQVRENTAFRVSYQRAGSGDEIVQLEPSSCKGGQVGPCYEVLNFPDLSQVDLGAGKGVCAQDIDGNPNSTDKIPQNCGNSGAKGLDSPGLATCMECIYGYNINYVCSRDNFATRPESFRMGLKDQDQTDATQQSSITTNNDTSLNHASNTALQVVAGYRYDLEINATNHQNDNNTPGYHAEFALDGNGSKRSLKLAWQTSTDDSKCNDIEDHNVTVIFKNGFTDLNLSSPQIGKYNLSIIDRQWTRVDWDPALMTHHTTGVGKNHFLLGADSDCIQNSSIVPVQNASTSAYTDDVSGCDITTAYNDPTNDSFGYHVNTNTNSVYTDIALRVHPYKFGPSKIIGLFDLDDINHSIGPSTRTSGQTFVYMDTPPTIDIDNTDMSYNMNGTFFAAGYDNSRLSNFVTGCYADDLNMDLNYTYNGSIPTQEPYLWYSIKDHNTTDSSVVYRPASGVDDFDRLPEPTVNTTPPLSIPQGKGFFAKEMNGAITMDLGYNFKRDYSTTVNPRYIEFKDFNITYVTNPSGIRADLKPATGDDFKIFGNKTLDHNVSFFYGRAKPSKDLYDDVTENNIDTPVSVLVYCDLGYTVCQDRGILSLFAQTNEANWWKSWDHKTADSDGNIELVSSPTSALNQTSVSIIGEGEDKTINVSRGTATPPLTIPVNLVVNDPANPPAPLNYTDRWLIYNPESATEEPSPFYRVKFIGGSGWSGYGETGHVVGGTSNVQKNRRLEW